MAGTIWRHLPAGSARPKEDPIAQAPLCGQGRDPGTDQGGSRGLGWRDEPGGGYLPSHDRSAVGEHALVVS